MRENMRKLAIIFSFLLLGCNSIETYKIEVIYFNGDKEVLIYKLDNVPHLDDGNIWVQGKGTILCGVRSYKILEIKKYE